MEPNNHVGVVRSNPDSRPIKSRPAEPNGAHDEVRWPVIKLERIRGGIQSNNRGRIPWNKPIVTGGGLKVTPQETGGV